MPFLKDSQLHCTGACGQWYQWNELPRLCFSHVADTGMELASARCPDCGGRIAEDIPPAESPSGSGSWTPALSGARVKKSFVVMFHTEAFMADDQVIPPVRIIPPEKADGLTEDGVRASMLREMHF